MATKKQESLIKEMTPMAKLSSTKKKEKVSITKPILKRKSLAYSEVDNIPEAQVEDYSKISIDEQTTLFNSIKDVFVRLREDAENMDLNTFEERYFSNMLAVFDMAVTGNVTAMDFLCYAYKKGMEGVLPVNLTLAHKWGMLAIADGSKLTVDRLRMFINPVFEYVENSDVDLENMMERYDVPDGEAAFFVAETFAGLYVQKMNITLEQMSREDPVSADSNFQKFIHDANKVRDEILPDMLKYLR